MKNKTSMKTQNDENTKLISVLLIINHQHTEEHCKIAVGVNIWC